MDSRERYDDPEEALRAAFRGMRAGVWTSLPAIVQSYDPANGTVTVQPAIQGVQQAPDGSVSAIEYPLLPDVPVCFPRGGGCTLTFPIAEGDECIVIFSARAIDAWWQSGHVQAPTEPRMHDMADGFALVGPFSQAKMIGSVRTDAVQLRADDGLSYVELVPAAGQVNIVAPGGFNVVAPTIGLIAAESGASDVSMTGNFNLTGTLTANGKRIDDTHRHGGVQTGSSNSGTVV
ncbi:MULTISPECIES: Gp138 family membrane-puncturing spike protein [unclassified Achromobacter]|uniref:Gp138 family membrane-puncturing spike protein n=1 Tax=unclassified Achromobacter TaxID=2626865 RepID=UPI000B51864E|nr:MULTISPECIES: Gp138 family membrane-puncturing spike protein [unclassified Achromobacter]OWT69205.1 hypothetical protein CEY05_28680 [Achromobacter sp. HZ34]OWT70610.1 hypothetical protein CEY04_27510 [Achromobacter sp. HZ28]